MRVKIPYRSSSFLPAHSIMLLLIVLGLSKCSAQEPRQAPPHRLATTLVVFSDPARKPIAENQWQALVAALRAQLGSNQPEIRALVDSQAAQETQILLGDKIVPGVVVTHPIPVYLHGDCEIAPPIIWDHTGRSDALGWVFKNHGQIEPFIHVDCKRIGEMLWARGKFYTRGMSDQLMAEAVSRVILHEWIHIATQNAGHSSHGIAKATLGINDLDSLQVAAAHPGK